MTAHRFRAGLLTGVTFGTATVFLVLIGFSATISDLIGELLGNRSATSILGLSPAMFNLVVFLAILGIWAGASTGKRLGSKAATWAASLLTAGVAGLALGILVGGLALLLGSLSGSGVRMSMYFAQLLPDAIRLFTMGRPPVSAGMFHLLLFVITGLLGGLIRRSVARGAIRRFLSGRLRAVSTTAQNSGALKLLRRSTAARVALFAVAAVLLALIPLGIGNYWNYTIGTIGIYVLLGLGLNIVVGLAGLLDLGYVAFFAIGGYTVALLTAPAHHVGWSFWSAIPIAIVLAAFAGIVLGVPVLRLRGDYLAIVTLGFGQIIAVLLRSDELTSFTGGPRGVSAVGGPELSGQAIGSPAVFVYMILLGVAVVVVVTRRLRNSRAGRAWEAMREDETVARAMGINTLSYKLLAFAVGAAFAGLGGVIFASRNQFTGPEDYNLMVSFNVLASVIVGGMGSVPGVVAGAFALKGLPEVLRELENYRVLAFGALLIVMMLVRPEGLIPSSRRKIELHRGQEAGAAPDSAVGKTDE